MNTTQEYEKGTTLLGYSPWRANIDLCYTVTRRGEQTLLSVTYSSPWRADYSPWRT